MRNIRLHLPYIYSSSINDAVDVINEFEDEDLSIEWFSYGGSTQAALPLAYAIQKRKKRTEVNIPGMAASMGAALLTYFDNVRASSKAKFLIHPVSAYNSTLRASVARDLYEDLKGTINEDRFEEVSGRTLLEAIAGPNIDENEIWLDARQAQYVGLVNDIYEISPDISNEVDEVFDSCPYSSFRTYINSNNQADMKLSEFKSQHPDLYNQVVAIGRDQAESNLLDSERNRVLSLAEFIDIDQSTVIQMIKDGSQADAKFFRTMAEKTKAKALANAFDNADEPEITPPSKTTTEELDEYQRERIKNLVKAGIDEEEAKKIVTKENN